MKAAFSGIFDDLELEKFCFENYINISFNQCFSTSSVVLRDNVRLDNSVKHAFDFMH